MRTILVPIFRLVFFLDKITDNILNKELRIGLSQFRILMVLAKHPESSQRTIAEFWNITEASANRQITNLSREKLITKKVNPRSKREHLLTLTSAGKEKIDRAISLMDKLFEKKFKTVEAKDRKLLADLLQNLLTSMEIDKKLFHNIKSNK